MSSLSPGVLALTNRSRWEGGLGLVIIGQNGVSSSLRICQIALKSSTGWWRMLKMVTFGSRCLGWGVSRLDLSPKAMVSATSRKSSLG